MRLLDSVGPDKYLLFSGRDHWRFERDDLSEYAKRPQCNLGLGPIVSTVVAYPRPGNGSET